MNSSGFSKNRKASVLIGIVLACFLGLYFRFYPVCVPLFPSSPSQRLLATQVLYKNLSDRLMLQASREFPGLSDQKRESLVREKAKSMIQAEPKNFKKAVRTTEQAIYQKNKRLNTKHYLLEADPYYFYELTYKVLQTGKMGGEYRNGKYFNPLRNAPHGLWVPVYWHPYVGAAWFRLLQLAGVKIDLMEALSYVPLLLFVVVVFAFFYLCSVLELSSFPSFCGAFCLSLAPIFIQRNSFGWYDTDPYNFIFPILIFAFLFSGIHTRRIRLYAFLCAFATACYAFFWGGWPLYWGFTVLYGLGIGLFKKVKKEKNAGVYFDFVFWYFIFSLLTLTILLTPVRVFDSVKNGFIFVRDFKVSKANLWPNLFLTVGETRSISLKKAVFVVGNIMSVAVACLGFVYFLLRLLKKRSSEASYDWAGISILTFICLFLTLRTERFSLLLVFPYSLWVAYAVQETVRLVSSARFRQFGVKLRYFSYFFFSIFLFPAGLLLAHISALEPKMIMNDAWYGVMMQLKEKTPQDSIVFSWWSPGHFIHALAERKTVLDGATQELPENYWMAKALLSQDEREAAGYFRMLSAGGNDAFHYLNSLGFKLSEGSELIFHLMLLNRAQAKQYVGTRLNEEQLEHFLDLVYGRGDLPPGYVLIFDDLIEQNLVVSTVGRWNFRKAEELHEMRQHGLKPVKLGGVKAYMHDLEFIAGRMLKYRPESRLLKKTGNRLIFANGLSVDMDSKEAMIAIPAQKIAGRPVSLFYMEGDTFKEKSFPDAQIDSSALLIAKEGTFTSVLADRELIRSLMFRLFYLKGKGFQLFKPFISEERPDLKTLLYVYEIDWNRLKEEEERDA